ncbi:MAG: hypothetical protein P1U85_18980 [Verrucomicrobiales bacterium]|nr:hypothetical protein [Verrucomicrobiales bacterium]
MSHWSVDSGDAQPAQWGRIVCQLRIALRQAENQNVAASSALLQVPLLSGFVAITRAREMNADQTVCIEQ